MYTLQSHPIWYQQHLSKAADENSVMKTTLHSTYLNFSNSFLSLNLFILSLFLFILFCWPNENWNAADKFYLILVFKLIVINIYKKKVYDQQISRKIGFHDGDLQRLDVTSSLFNHSSSSNLFISIFSCQA